MDQSVPNRQQGGAPQHAIPVGAFRQGNIPSKERGIISGDKVQFGKLRRPIRLSQSESSGAEEERLSTSMEARGSFGRSPVLQGMQAEGNPYHRGVYEQAEGHYQRRLASNGNGPLSSSPRSPNTRGYLSFQSRRTHGQQQDQGHPVTTVKASGTPHRQYSRGRNRTSSETEQGGKGSRGPTQRRRGLSETESRPRWDNTKMSGLQCLASENIWFDKHSYDEAEKRFYEGVNGPSTQHQQVKTALQQAKGRQQKRQHRNVSPPCPALLLRPVSAMHAIAWDDETDMAKLEECVRSVQMDGLLWGASKLVPVGYGIKKLQINCVVEDDKVGTDILEEEITKFEDFIQSVDVAAFNKI
ncbi:uncharacterized protein LOC118334476 [Morone saxatilis]|uniref:uncharacterized protein LOC118334476 n=1 Tax=Morone saxatilis TaxID=34816 RepID=UPI0015E246DD|nr:uncharacterized protein LOC118334476 [Morone saxatilis]